jgi:hypothetical protein
MRGNHKRKKLNEDLKNRKSDSDIKIENYFNK